MNKLRKIPKFKNEVAERNFWATHDSSEYLDWNAAQQAVFPNLKPSTRTISLRLPQHLLVRLQTQAHEQDVPYQSYIKMLLAQSIGLKHKNTRKIEKAFLETAT